MNAQLPQCKDYTVGATCPCPWEIRAKRCSSKGAWYLPFSGIQLEAWGRGAGKREKSLGGRMLTAESRPRRGGSSVFVADFL